MFTTAWDSLYGFGKFLNKLKFWKVFYFNLRQKTLKLGLTISRFSRLIFPWEISRQQFSRFPVSREKMQCLVVVWAHEMNFLFSRHCLKNSSLLFGLRVDVLLFFVRLKVSHIWLFWKYLFSFEIGLTGNTFCIITKLISSSIKKRKSYQKNISLTEFW